MSKPLLIPFALAVSGADPVFSDNKKTPRRFRKDAIRVGKFIARNPIDGSDIELDVTPDRINKWHGAFSRMQANGVKVDLTVDHKSGAEAKRGEIINMLIDGDTLLFDSDLVDDDSVLLAQRCPEVSVEIEPGYKDGKGNEYGEAITAITICRKPVVPDQGPFLPIAASQSNRTDDQRFLIFCANSTQNANTGSETTMFSEEQLKGIRQQLGLAEDIKDEEVASKIVASLQTVGEADKAKKDLTAAQTKITELEGKLEKANAGDKPITLSREVEVLSKRALSQDIKGLIDAGSITPACGEKLTGLLSTTVMLSIPAGADNPNYAGIIDALKENKVDELAKILGEKTGGQVVQLSRDTPAGGGSTSKPDDWVNEVVKSANEAAGTAK